MSTMTKPRPRAGTGKGPMMPSAQRIEQAKKLVTTTKRKITAEMADEDANRSTRSQRVQRIKAAAWDEFTQMRW